MLASLILSCLSAATRGAGEFTDGFGGSIARVEHRGSKQPDWVAVGSPHMLGGKNAGAVYCFGGVGHELLWRAKEQVGSHLSEIADVDGDSVSDLLANVRGEIVVLSGAKGTRIDSLPAGGGDRWGPVSSIQGTDGACLVTALLKAEGVPMGVTCISLHSRKELWTFGGSDLVHLRLTCVAPMPDLDHDGVEEVLVGYGDSTPTHFREQAERVVCLSGSSGKQLFEVRGPAGDRLGYSVAECGDWNGDGIPDFVAGAPTLGLVNNGITPQAGYALVCSGGDGAILDRVEPASKSVGFGYSVAPRSVRAGAEPRSFLVVASGDIGDGAAFLCSWKQREPRRLCAKGPLTDFGHLVHSIGDQDGDASPDFAVSSAPDSADAMQDGYVGLYSSKDGKELCVLRRPKD